MKFEDVEVGMKAVWNNTDIIKVVSKNHKSEYIQYESYFSDTIGYCIASEIEPFIGAVKHQPEFVWDYTVRTIGEPFESKNGKWFIKVDGSISSVYDKPKTFYYYKNYDNSVQESKVYAIVPNTPYKYILMDNRMCCDMFLPVTYNPKEIEVTMEELEKKYGCKVKIKK